MGDTGGRLSPERLDELINEWRARRVTFVKFAPEIIAASLRKPHASWFDASINPTERINEDVAQ